MLRVWETGNQAIEDPPEERRWVDTRGVSGHDWRDAGY